MSQNFTDMEKMTKPAFGTAPLNFEIDESKDDKPGEDVRSQFLWGFVSKNILDPLTANESTPYLIKVNNSRLEAQNRIFMQEFATAHNLKV